MFPWGYAEEMRLQMLMKPKKNQRFLEEKDLSWNNHVNQTKGIQCFLEATDFVLNTNVNNT